MAQAVDVSPLARHLRRPWEFDPAEWADLPCVDKVPDY